jgi:hypothetical protein
MNSTKELRKSTSPLQSPSPSSSSLLFSLSRNKSQLKTSIKVSKNIKNLCVYKRETKKLNQSRRNSDTMIQSSNNKSQFLKLPLSRVESRSINESASNIPSYLSSPTSGRLSPNESLFIYDTFLRPPSSPLSHSNSSISSNSPNQSECSLFHDRSIVSNNNTSVSSNSNNANTNHKNSLSRMVPDLLKSFNSRFLFKRHSITVIKDANKKLSKSNQVISKTQSKSNLKKNEFSSQSSSRKKLFKTHSNSEDVLKPHVKINLYVSDRYSLNSHVKSNQNLNETEKKDGKIKSKVKSFKKQKAKRSRSAPNNKVNQNINHGPLISTVSVQKQTLSKHSSINSNFNNFSCKNCEKKMGLSKKQNNK